MPEAPRNVTTAARAAFRPKTIAWTIVVGLLSAYSLSVMWTNILPTRHTLAATEQRLREVKHENEAYLTMLRHSDHEGELLERDPWTVQRILRDEFRMSKPGERIVR